MNYKLAIISGVLMVSSGIVLAQDVRTNEVLTAQVNKGNAKGYDFKSTEVYNNDMFVVTFAKKDQKTREEVKAELLKAKETNTLPKTNNFSPF